MAEFITDAVADIAVGSNALFTDTLVEPCPCVRHRRGSGIFTLRGGHKYFVLFTGNVTNATAATEVTLALTIGGEEIVGSRMASTPSAANAYNNIGTFAEIEVPCGCCYTLAVENIGTTTATLARSKLRIRKED